MPGSAWPSDTRSKESDRRFQDRRLVIGDTALLGADALPGSYESPRGFSLLLNLDDPGETERLFCALAENGTVRTPLQETFWAHLFGVLTDQFGISWDINYEKSE